MNAKYIKIDVGDLITTEEGIIGLIVSKEARFPLEVKSKNPCGEIPLNPYLPYSIPKSYQGRSVTGAVCSIDSINLMPLQNAPFHAKKRQWTRKKEPVFTIRFPLKLSTMTYFARDIAHNVRTGKWKLIKGKRNETQNQTT